MLTLLVVPTFYDSIELAREGAKAKYLARAERMSPFLAFMMTFGEAIMTLVFARYGFRLYLSLRGRSVTGQTPAHGGTPIQAQSRSPASP
jgi:hypothetical protein